MLCTPRDDGSRLSYSVARVTIEKILFSHARHAITKCDAVIARSMKCDEAISRSEHQLMMQS